MPLGPWTGEARRLADRIAAFIHGSLQGDPPEPFEALALAIHRWQAAHAPVIAALTEPPVTDWTQIPAVPVNLFRQLPVGTVPPDEVGATFRTSGTTGGRGVHRMRSTALYDLNALAWAARCVPDLPTRTVALLTDPAEAPDSSLSHMVHQLALRASSPEVSWHLHDGRVDATGVAAQLAGAPGPVFLASTAFAMDALLSQDPPPLPVGSVCMVTGGFKGRETSLDDAGLYAQVQARLRPARLVTEYGMTELSSQLWGTPGKPYSPPPWLRVVAVDPRDGQRLPAGQPGQLRFYDLCNLDSTVGIETFDEGVVHDDGRVTLIGRITDAPLRGCSLTVDEAWARR